MSQRQLVKILNPKEGYNIIANNYKKFHHHLDSFDNGSWQKYLPRNLEGKVILDLGAGDGRIFKYISKYSFGKFIANDISDQMLKRHTKSKNIIKKVFDLNKKRNIEDNSIDVITGFFVIEYLLDLNHFSSEIVRVLKNGGMCIFGYFLQRKEWKHKSKNGEFKIKIQNWDIDEIKNELEYFYLKTTIVEVVLDNLLLGYHIICEKN